MRLLPRRLYRTLALLVALLIGASLVPAATYAAYPPPEFWTDSCGGDSSTSPWPPTAYHDDFSPADVRRLNIKKDPPLRDPRKK